MMDYEIVVLGDSVTWGQGLLEKEKSYSLVFDALSAKHSDWRLTLSVRAHSGATIDSALEWKLGTQAADCSEVPVSLPTVRQQCARYVGAPEQVGLVILDGGINDIDIRFILNPFTKAEDLTEQITRHCYAGMLTLLGEVDAKFSNPNATIIVLGYYPMLSRDTDLPWIPPFLGEVGVGTFPGLHEYSVISKVMDLSLQFWRESDSALDRAVREANDRATKKRFVFAKLPFSEQNALFATDPWLFGLDEFFNPEDHVIAERRRCCEVVLYDFIAIQQCYRASAGHPNVKGSQMIADTILGLANLK